MSPSHLLCLPKVANTVCLHYILYSFIVICIVGCNSLIYRLTCMAMFSMPDYAYALYCGMYSSYILFVTLAPS